MRTRTADINSCSALKDPFDTPTTPTPRCVTPLRQLRSMTSGTRTDSAVDARRSQLEPLPEGEEVANKAQVKGLFVIPVYAG